MSTSVAVGGASRKERAGVEGGEGGPRRLVSSRKLGARRARSGRKSADVEAAMVAEDEAVGTADEERGLARSQYSAPTVSSES